MKPIKPSLIAKLLCWVLGHKWSRWTIQKGTHTRSRFCKRACGVARETRSPPLDGLLVKSGPNYDTITPNTPKE